MSTVTKYFDWYKVRFKVMFSYNLKCHVQQKNAQVSRIAQHVGSPKVAAVETAQLLVQEITLK